MAEGDDRELRLERQRLQVGAPGHPLVEEPRLDEVPFEGHPLGQKIYEKVSKEAWKMWVEHMKMLMNEYRLNLGTSEAQEFLIQQMDNYFFGEGAALPPDFVPPKAKA